MSILKKIEKSVDSFTDKVDNLVDNNLESKSSKKETTHDYNEAMLHMVAFFASIDECDEFEIKYLDEIANQEGLEYDYDTFQVFTKDYPDFNWDSEAKENCFEDLLNSLVQADREIQIKTYGYCLNMADVSNDVSVSNISEEEQSFLWDLKNRLSISSDSLALKKVIKPSVKDTFSSENVLSTINALFEKNEFGAALSVIYNSRELLADKSIESKYVTCLVKEKHYESCIEYLSGKDDFEFASELGFCYEKTGKKEDALRLYKRAGLDSKYKGLNKELEVRLPRSSKSEDATKKVKDNNLEKKAIDLYNKNAKHDWAKIGDYTFCRKCSVPKDDNYASNVCIGAHRLKKIGSVVSCPNCHVELDNNMSMLSEYKAYNCGDSKSIIAQYIDCDSFFMSNRNDEFVESYCKKN